MVAYILVTKITDGRVDGSTRVIKLIQWINFSQTNSNDENGVYQVTPLVHGETLIGKGRKYHLFYTQYIRILHENFYLLHHTLEGVM